MCLAVPAQILEKKGSIGKVDFGKGIHRDVDLSLVDAGKGDYVLVHAGFAIHVLKEEDAKKTLEIWDQILSLE